MPLDSIEAYPWFLNKPLPVTVADVEVVTKITVHEWTDHLRPLLAHFHDMLDKHPNRLMIAIGGPPGTGKSVLAEQLCWIIEKGFLKRGSHAVSLPMDGFHFPNEYLKSHSIKHADGTRTPLTDMKGSPETFDIAALLQHLRLLRANTQEEVFWPGYTRMHHDVLPGKYRIHRTHNVLIVEGNYMLVDRGPFSGMAGLFDLKMYVEMPGAGIISNLMQRHMAGGKTMEEAKEWVKRIDLPNARVAESTRQLADVVIERNTVDDITSLNWRGAGKVGVDGDGAVSPAGQIKPAAVTPKSA